MSVLTAPLKFGNKPATEPAQPQRVTVAEFHQQWEEGRFEGRKPMLLDGEVFEMPMPGPKHSMGIGLAQHVLTKIFGTEYWLRPQLPLPLNLWSDPVPDWAIVEGSPRSYALHPTSALLVVEVADSSLQIDSGIKAALYAAGLIADYWVIDTNNRKLIVYRSPQANTTNPRQSSYADVVTYDETASVSPLAMPGAVVLVFDMLP